MYIPLFHIGSFEVRFIDVIDVLIVSYLLYFLYKLLRGSIAIKIFVGVIILYGLWWAVGLLDMKLLSFILSKFIGFGVIILIIIFQPEVRRFLVALANTTLRGRFTFFERFFRFQTISDVEKNKGVRQMKKAILNFSATKTGALIVLMNGRDPEMFHNNGTYLNAKISQVLLETIFQKQSPMHDGAAIISKDKIYSAGTVLPLSSNPDIPQKYGLRHRAALGITESTMVAVIVVSEEKGTISYVFKGKLTPNISEQVLEEKLSNHLVK